MEYTCFNQRGGISTLNDGSLKLVNTFAYLQSGVSSEENYINRQLAKEWKAIDKLSILWKSDQSDKKKLIFPSSSCVNTTIWMHQMDAD